MSDKHLIELKDEIMNLLHRLPNPLIPNFMINDNLIYFQGNPLYEVWKDGNLWNWKITERGQLCLEKKIDDRLDLVVAILNLYITAMASTFELHNRVPGQDFRKLWFAYHDMLFTILGEPYISKAQLFYKNNRYNGTFNDNL